MPQTPDATYWHNLQVGDPVPALQVVPDHRQIFMFSAATWNRHHIHYSKDAAIREGFPDIVVQRGLIGNFMARQISGWIRHAGEIQILNWLMTATAHPGEVLTCSGKVTRKEVIGGCYLLRCSLVVTKEAGQTVARGEAKVKLTHIASAA